MAVGILALALATAAYYFDLSFDGQWYHQSAIFNVARDWNPLTDPMREFPTNHILWLRHYAKGPWYFAAAVYQTTGQIEWGKCFDVISWACMFMAVLAAALDWGMSRARGLAIALVVSLNPVVTSVLTAYLIEAVLASFLTVTIAALFGGFCRPQPLVIWTGIAAAIVTINAKLTGLVYIPIVFAAGGLWCVLRHRAALRTYAGLALLTLLLGAGVFGFNPYLTNTIHRHHPFYPVLGTKEFPSLSQQGKEGIERYETPKNLLGRNRFVRMAYTTFGRPGNAPYIQQKNAELMWPLTARFSDLKYYYYHETRVAGFGPLFSAAILLSLALGVWGFFHPGVPRLAFALVAITIIGATTLSVHMWWPRYSPQVWLLALAPVVLIFSGACSRRMTGAAWVLVTLLGVNAAIVAGVRMTWETQATQTLRRQLADLQHSGKPIEISFNYFQQSGQEKLEVRGIPYVMKGRSEIKDGLMLMSVVDGYPGAIRYRNAPAVTADAK